MINMKKKNVQIALHGCDDSTYINLDVAQNEFNFLLKLKELSEQESSYQCMPTLDVEEYI
jgi:hypothetical protein